MAQVLGDRGVEPCDDAGVNLEPLRIVKHEGSINGAIDVVRDTELLESQIKELTPGGELRINKIKDDGDMSMDVDHGNGGGRQGWWRIDMEGVRHIPGGAIGGRRWARRGRKELKIN